MDSYKILPFLLQQLIMAPYLGLSPMLMQNAKNDPSLAALLKWRPFGPFGPEGDMWAEITSAPRPMGKIAVDELNKPETRTP